MSQTSRDKGRLNYRSCLRKERYPTEFEAARVARRIKEIRGQVLHVYECALCNYGFHLTKRKKDDGV